MPDDIPLHVVIRHGAAHNRILEFAGEDGSDLIIIGRQGSRSIGKVFFGNVTEKVVRKSHCAVLVVPMEFVPPDMTDTTAG